MTKADKLRRVRSILDKYADIVARDDALWLVSEVFRFHPRWSDKRGCGGGKVVVKTVYPYGSRCFWLVRADGTAVDISFRECLAPKSHNRRVMNAARFEVDVDIQDWKANHPPPLGGMHCDHVMPFDYLFGQFLETAGILPEDIKIKGQSVGFIDEFEDRDLASAWREFHAINASFQWLTAEANIAKSNRVEMTVATNGA